MPVIVRALFPPAICEIEPWEASDLLLTMLNDVILSLKAESLTLDSAMRQAAIADVERQIAELEAYRKQYGADGRKPSPRHLE